MIIREATESDLKNILTLFLETIQSINKRDYTPEQITAWGEGAKDTHRWLKKIEEQYFVIAESEARLAGFASITKNGYLDTMFVSMDFQRQGVASLLIQALINYAYRYQVKEITTEASITALSFFEKNEFSIIEKQEVNRKGIGIINYKMKKVL